MNDNAEQQSSPPGTPHDPPDAAGAEAIAPHERIRVWAEERGSGKLLVTWAWSEPHAEERDDTADARTVAATLGAIEGVTATEPAEDGVLVSYDPAAATKTQLASGVRRALSLDEDLKARATALMKRAPTYASLAKSLALDERVSPMPEVARSARARKGGPATPALGMIPGLRFISQIQLLIPVLRTLSSWSRTASPEVVHEHLSKAGMTREQLDADLATANEAMAFAKAYAAERASIAAQKAGAVASQARDWVRKQASDFQEQAKKPSAPRDEQ